MNDMNDMTGRCDYQCLGNWDLAQVCDHLADAFHGSMHGFDMKIPWLVRKLVAPVVMHYVMAAKPLPFRARLPKRLEPLAGKAPAVCVARLREQVAAFEAWPMPLAPHPLFGSIPRELWQRIDLLHMGHHLGFLFPKPA